MRFVFFWNTDDKDYRIRQIAFYYKNSTYTAAMIKTYWVLFFCTCMIVPSAMHGNVVQQSDTGRWIDDVREFRTAVYQQNKDKIKSYIDFPVSTRNNEIWNIVYGGKGQDAQRLAHENKPFTEKDFDLHYTKLFSKNFVAALLKIKTDELYRKGETETITLHDGAATTYKMYASFDKDHKTLQLNLAFKFLTEAEKGAEPEFIESNEIYFFDITATGKIKFRKIMIAG